MYLKDLEIGDFLTDDTGYLLYVKEANTRDIVLMVLNVTFTSIENQYKDYYYHPMKFYRYNFYKVIDSAKIEECKKLLHIYNKMKVFE